MSIEVATVHATIDEALLAAVEEAQFGDIIEIHDQDCEEGTECTCEPLRVEVVPAAKS